MAEDNLHPISQTELEGKLNSGESLKDVVIGDVDFSGQKFTQNWDFSDAVVLGRIKFKSCRFLRDGQLNFARVKFLEKAHLDFFSAQFFHNIKVFISLATFSGSSQINFSYSQFYENSEVLFSETKLSDQSRIVLSETKFSDESRIMFSENTLSDKSKIDFTGAKFSDQAQISFLKNRFSNDSMMDFSWTRFSGNSEFLWINTKWHSQGLMKAWKMQCEDHSKVRFESADLNGASFYLTDLEKFIFKNITWREENERFIKRFVIKDEFLFRTSHYDELSELNENTQLSKAEKRKQEREFEVNYFRQVEILYRQLKRNYEDQRDYHGAGDFHFGELEMRRKQKTFWGQWTSLTLPYRLLSGYGEKWGRALVSFFIAVSLFSGLNLLWIQPKETSTTTWEQSSPITKFVDSSLFTFKLMTFQRDLHYKPIDDPVLGRVGKFVLNLEFLIGPTLIALMLLAIRRQFRR